VVSGVKMVTARCQWWLASHASTHTRAAFGQSIDGLLVSLWIPLALLGKLVKVHIKSVVCLRDVFLKVLACSRSGAFSPDPGSFFP
jgi:hypothetical protein